MTRKLGPIAGLVAAVLLVLFAGACQRDKSYRAERFDVDILVHENGSATITETVTFAFRGGPFTYAFREISTAETDGIDGLALHEDGRPYTMGTELGQYEVAARRGALRVTWHFTPSENTARTFVLSYRVDGLIRREGPQDALRWAAVPPRHEYGINQAQVVVRLPDSVGPLGGVRVLEGHAQPSILGRHVSLLATDIEPNRPLVIGVWFPRGQVRGVPPAWQERQMAQRAQAPLWIALAGLVLALGLGGAAWAWRVHGRERVAVAAGLATAAPSDLAPGLAGALVHNGARRADALATLFDLSRRGVLAVEEGEGTGPGRRRRPAYAFRLLGLPPDLRPFELQTLQIAALKTATGQRRLGRKERAAGLPAGREMLEALMAEGRAIPLEDLGAGLQANWRTLARAYDVALHEQGLFDPGRERVRRRLSAAGLAVVAASVLSVVPAALWAPRFGPWPFLACAALFVAGVALHAASLATARRSADGEQWAGRWRAFRQHLQEVARGRGEPGEAALLERHLSYAVAFGLAERWARRMAAAEAPVPAWFRTLSQEAEAGERAAAFVAVIAAASAGSYTGGAAAAGGGASGAG